MDSFLRNCLISPREGEVIFSAYTDSVRGDVVAARLDGYAVIPREVYEDLLSPKSGPTDPPVDPSRT